MYVVDTLATRCGIVVSYLLLVLYPVDCMSIITIK